MSPTFPLLPSGYVYMSLFYFLLFKLYSLFYTKVIVFFVIFCTLAAVAHTFPHLWVSKGILILILDDDQDNRGPPIPLYSSLMSLMHPPMGKSSQTFLLPSVATASSIPELNCFSEVLTHRPDVQLPYPTTLRPLCCLLSDPFGRKVALKHIASTCCLLRSSVYVLRLREMP